VSSKYDGITYHEFLRLAHAKLDFLKWQRSIEDEENDLEGRGPYGLRTQPEPVGSDREGIL